MRSGGATHEIHGGGVQDLSIHPPPSARQALPPSASTAASMQSNSSCAISWLSSTSAAARRSSTCSGDVAAVGGVGQGDAWIPAGARRDGKASWIPAASLPVATKLPAASASLCSLCTPHRTPTAAAQQHYNSSTSAWYWVSAASWRVRSAASSASAATSAAGRAASTTCERAGGRPGGQVCRSLCLCLWQARQRRPASNQPRSSPAAPYGARSPPFPPARIRATPPACSGVGEGEGEEEGGMHAERAPAEQQ